LALPEANRLFYERMTIADRKCHEEGYYHEAFNAIGRNTC
jgi:hypothetical protein